MNAATPLWALGIVVGLVWWDVRKRAKPRSIYCVGLTICGIVYIAAWITSVCNLSDAVLILELLFLRFSLAVAFLSRFFEELVGKVKTSDRMGRSAVWHFFIAGVTGFCALKLAFGWLCDDHIHTTNVCTKTRKYFSGASDGGYLLIDQDEKAEKPEKPKPQPKSSEEVKPIQKHSPGHSSGEPHHPL